jgi:flagellin-like protein
MRGISTVIATLMMLVITIALAGMAYMYISGVFTAQTQGIEIVDSYCVGNTVNVVLRNIGTLNVSTAQIVCTQTAPTTGSCSLSPSTTILPGNQTQLTLSPDCSGTGARTCAYRLVPPAGRAIQVVVTCT